MLNWIPYVIVLLDTVVHVIVLIGKSGRLSVRTWHDIIVFTPVFFTVQEMFLSSLYVYLFIRFMKQDLNNARTKAMFRFLIFAQLFILCFDVAMVTLNSLKYEIAKTVLTPFFYSSKLKMEFWVLNRLMGFRQSKAGLGSIDSETSAYGANKPRQQDRVSGSSGTGSNSQTVTETSDYTSRQNGVPSTFPINSNDHHTQMEDRTSDDIHSTERRYLGRFGTDENI